MAMDCPPGIYICMDALYHVEQQAAMPPCYSDWKPLPTPIPAGSYVIVFTARVAEKGMTIAVVTYEGKPVATLRFPEQRSWECRKPTRIDPDRSGDRQGAENH